MVISHLEHDLFLLLINLSRLTNRERIINLFLEAMNSLDIGINIHWQPDPVSESGEVIEIATARHSFGWLRLEGNLEELQPEISSLFQNAVSMLAVILENRVQAQLLADENLRLEELVRDRVHEWIEANDKLQKEIMDRQQIEMALRASEEQLRLVIQNMPIMMDAFDENGAIIVWNRECEQITGYKAEEIIGSPLGLELLYPNAENRQQKFNDLISHDHDFKWWEWEISCKDGSTRLVSWSNISNSFPIPGWYSWAIGMDITERKQAEEELLASLKEKEILLREVHHRVKNNMQVMISLLGLQTTYVSDPKMLEMLRESQNRVRSMAIVHEELYQSDNLARINFAGYVSRLASSLLYMYQSNPQIKLELEIGDVSLGVDTAIPCGLIINELITNALKYAFPQNREGSIWVKMAGASEGNWKLAVVDDGIGFPAHLDFHHTETLGLQLVNILTAQLDGVLELDASKGTTVTILFPNPEKKENQST
jgi:PAS domain S-box-containing protein